MRTALWLLPLLLLSGSARVYATAHDVDAESRQVRGEKDGIAKAQEERSQPKLAASDLVGRWHFYPGDHLGGVDLRADTTMTYWPTSNQKYFYGGGWTFNVDTQEMIFVTKYLKRVYKAKREGGSIILCEGRDVFYKGITMNTLLGQPWDRMTR